MWEVYFERTSLSWENIWWYVDFTHIISSHLWYDLMKMYMLAKLIICVLIGVTIVAAFFVAKINFNYFEDTFFACQVINKLNKNAHAEKNFAVKSPFILPNGNPPVRNWKPRVVLNGPDSTGAKDNGSKRRSPKRFDAVITTFLIQINDLADELSSIKLLVDEIRKLPNTRKV